MNDGSPLSFTSSRPLTIGVELELQLVTPRDYDLTRAATDLLAGLRYDDRFGEIKLEITESMIEVNSRPRQDVTAIALDLDGLREVLVTHCQRNNIAIHRRIGIFDSRLCRQIRTSQLVFFIAMHRNDR